MKLGPRSLRIAAIASAISSIVAGACLFVAFRISVQFTSTQIVGAWSLMQSIFILARLPDMGLGLNLIRLVAVRVKEAPNASIRNLLFAGMIVSTAPVLIVGLVTIPFGIWLFHAALGIPANSTIPLLPFALYSCFFAVLNTIASILLAILEGHGRIVTRNVISMIAYGVLAVAIYPLIRWFGPSGIGIAYAVYAAILVAAAGLAVLRHANFGADPDSQGVTDIIRSIWRENFSVSTMALTRVTFEPWTKFLVSLTGGLAMVAHLDLAFRVSTQLRVTMQAAMQPLMFAGARREGKASPEIMARFHNANGLAVRMNVAMFTAQLLAAALLSWLGLGSVQPDFIIFLALLAAANGVNSAGVVGYYFAVSGGTLGQVVRIHLLMMVLNFVLGALGSVMFGPFGALAGYLLSFTYGGLALVAIWARAISGRWTDAIDPMGRLMVLGSAILGAAYLVSVPFWIALPGKSLALASFLIAAGVCAPLGLLLFRPMLQELGLRFGKGSA